MGKLPVCNVLESVSDILLCLRRDLSTLHIVSLVLVHVCSCAGLSSLLIVSMKHDLTNLTLLFLVGTLCVGTHCMARNTCVKLQVEYGFSK